MSADETRLQSTVRAFMVARCRANVAEYETGHLLHMAIYDARACGLSVRATAQLLRVPKSTIARHWLAERARDLGIGTPDGPPLWGTQEEFLAAQRAIWAHDPSQIDGCPFTWTEQPDGSRTVTYLAPTAYAILDEGASVPRWVTPSLYIDGLARRVVERLHPQVELTPEVLDAASAAVSQDIVGAVAILEDDTFEGFDLDRQADLRTRRSRGYYLPPSGFGGAADGFGGRA